MLFEPIQPWYFGFTPSLVAFGLSQILLAAQREAELDRKMIQAYTNGSADNELEAISE